MKIIWSGLMVFGTLVVCGQQAFAQTNVIQLRNGANSTTIVPSATTTINLQLPSLTSGTHYLLTSSTDPGSSGLGPILTYGPATTQNTLAVSASNYLFDISYANTVVNAAALGARISSTATDGNNNATGLTISATATGSGNAKALSVSATSTSGTTDAVYISSGRLTFLESTGATYVTSFVAGDQSANIAYTLPTADGTNGQALQFGTGGVLSWASVPSVASLDDLSDATVSANSVFLGSQPLVTYTGTNNTAVGIGPFQALAAGSNNTAAGYNALNAVTSGSGNTGVGYEALKTISTSEFNTAVGSMSQSLATASYSTSVGYQSGYQITGNGNTALGYRALRGATSGTYNVAIGYDAMYGGGTGSYNVAIGYLSLQGNDGTPNTGSYNTAIGGNNAPNLNSGGSNVMLGYDAGAALTSGSQNVIIGKGAGDDLTSGTGNVIIGYAVGSANNIDTESNLLLIDNSNTTAPLIEGDFTNGSEYVKVNGDLQVSGGGMQLGAAGAAINVGVAGAFLANAVTIDATAYATVQINSDNDGINDVVTITGGTDGMLMHLYYNKTGTDDIEIGGVVYPITDNKSAGITACRINGTWRVVALVVYP